MKAYITTYALTGGIKEKNGRDAGDGTFCADGEMFGYYHGDSWHKTRAAAHCRPCAVKSWRRNQVNNQGETR